MCETQEVDMPITCRRHEQSFSHIRNYVQISISDKEKKLIILSLRYSAEITKQH